MSNVYKSILLSMLIPVLGYALYSCTPAAEYERELAKRLDKKAKKANDK